MSEKQIDVNLQRMACIVSFKSLGLIEDTSGSNCETITNVLTPDMVIAT